MGIAEGGRLAAEVVSMGRVGVDLYPMQIGVGLEDVQTFGKFLGGSAANVAVAAARYGHSVALVSRTGQDPFGRYVRRSLAGFGVDATHVLSVESLPTPVTFCEIFPPDDFPLYFYRFPQAPDLTIEARSLPLPLIQDARIYWSTVTGLSSPVSNEAHVAAWAARARREHTVLDLDYRPMFWESEHRAGVEMGKALEQVSVVVGNRDECRVAVGETEPQRAADALLERGVELAIVKKGPGGVLAATTDERVEVPPVSVDVLNGLGAGDAFGGALIHGLLEGWSLGRIIRFANGAGAYVASKLECSGAMPDESQVSALLDSQVDGETVPR